MTHDRSDAEDAEREWNIDPRKLRPHDWFEIFQNQPPCHGAADLFTYGPDPELDRASAFVVATRVLQEKSANSAFFAKTVVVLPPDAPTTRRSWQGSCAGPSGRTR
ncbi:MAG TPA: hypothetical protein VK932_10970 [Kofleriaceae bacterium]|nr:hypothetical protein [Kofleriaceae bacterium]